MRPGKPRQHLVLAARAMEHRLLERVEKEPRGKNDATIRCDRNPAIVASAALRSAEMGDVVVAHQAIFTFPFGELARRNPFGVVVEQFSIVTPVPNDGASRSGYR